MAKSKKDIKKAQQKADADAGITTRDPRVAEKAAKAALTASCTICLMDFKLTAKMGEARQHAESKHPKSTYEICFPAQEA